MLRSAFNDFNNTFANEHVLDLYVFCLSEHAKEDTDGLLSMWRGYGGNGSGAAIVFDTAKITAREESPLIIAKVHYGTREAQSVVPTYSDQWGEVKTQLVNGESWVDALNHVLDFQNVTEIISVRNLKDVPLNEQISLVETKFSPRKRGSSPHFAQIKWG